MKHSLRWGVTLMSLITWACGAEPLPMLEPAARSFSFAVLGDLHFSRPAFERQQTLRAIAASLKTVQPPLALVCHTGDLVSGEDASHRQWDAAGMAEEFADALACVTNAFQVPFFMAVGNHDRHGGGTVYAQTILPFFSRSLAMPVSRPYFAFCYGNACFVFLDYMEYKATARREPEYREQQAFLEETLAAVRANPGGAVFGVGSVRLEVTLSDGSALGSAVCDRFYFSAPRPDGQESAHAAYGWDLIPAALRDSVAAGEPLGPLPVRFLAGDQTLIRR